MPSLLGMCVLDKLTKIKKTKEQKLSLGHVQENGEAPCQVNNWDLVFLVYSYIPYKGFWYTGGLNKYSLNKQMDG